MASTRPPRPPHPPQPDSRSAIAPVGDAGIDFEKAVEDVEGIIRRIESGEIGLEQSLAEYERGTRLLGVCREWLSKAEQRVRDLSAEMKKRTDGENGA